MSPEIYSKLKRMQLKKASESVDDDDTISYALEQSVASLQKVKIIAFFVMMIQSLYVAFSLCRQFEYENIICSVAPIICRLIGYQLIGSFLEISVIGKTSRYTHINCYSFFFFLGYTINLARVARNTGE